MATHRYLILPILIGASLAGCGGGAATSPDSRTASSPPISDQSISHRQPDSPYRTVVRGDTLYSIAWESGQDYRDLAKWNQIPSPYLIKPGQTLRVVPPGRATPGAESPKPSRVAVPDRGASNKADTPKPVVKTPPRKQASSPVLAKTEPSRPKSRTETKQTAKLSPSKQVRQSGWSWPADGALINRYSEGDSKGLDIAGARGAAVRAAASGRVVYQGSGLRGYGQLIIIKHDDEFLSAYAHNDKAHVKEGDAVKRGQKIADMGNTGTDRIKLHFEIRRRGVPVDPLKYLPKR